MTLEKQLFFSYLSRLNNLRLWVVLSLMMAFWTEMLQVVMRFDYREDETWGLLALVFAFYFCPWVNLKKSHERGVFVTVFILLSGYFVLYSWLPETVKGLWAMFTISLAFLGRGAPWGLYQLLLMVFPLVTTLQFFFGFPLRTLATQLAALLLSFSGMNVEVDGVVLFLQGQEIIIDEACSGIRMLWFGLFLAASLSCLYRLIPMKTVFLNLIALVLNLSSNAIRTALVSLLSLVGIGHEHVLHHGAGVVAFLIISLGLYKSSTLLIGGTTHE